MNHTRQHNPPSLETMRRVGQGPKSHPMRWAFGAVVALIAFGWTWSLVNRADNELAAPTDEIIGAWTTTHPRYADRGFVISLERIDIRVGPDEVQAYPIRSVTREVLETGTTYVITYPTSEGLLTFEMTVNPAGEARLDNLDDVIWMRR